MSAKAMSDADQYFSAPRKLSFGARIKNHYKRWWWAHLLLVIVILLVVLLPL